MKVTAKKALLIGLASSTMFGVAGCTTERNMEADVYGPPIYLEDTMEDEVEYTTDTAEDEYSGGEEDR